MPADEVDEIVAAWQRERPDLDARPLQVLSRVTRLAQHLDAARRSAFERNGLDVWEFDVLAALRRSGAPYAMSAGHLATATHVTSGTMTNRIDRLTERGLVRREADPADRRGVQVHLTAEGRQRVDAAFTTLVDSEAALLAAVPPESRDDVADVLRTLIGQFASGD